MNRYKLFRSTHKWLGIIFAVVFLNISVTGLLLLEKKNFSCIQPETKQGAPGSTGQFITNQQLFNTIFSQAHEDFGGNEDIDRVDFRPGNRVFKVHSKKNYTEMQIDAVTGDVLSIAKRNSDLIESLHDGSFFGGLVHDVMMPAVAIVTGVLTITGLYLWLAPVIKRRTKRA